jgi:RNA polymerase sigma-70 factor (ECF subfamily)
MRVIYIPSVEAKPPDDVVCFFRIRRNLCIPVTEPTAMKAARLPDPMRLSPALLPPIAPGAKRVSNNDWGAWMVAAQAGNAAVYRRLLAELGAWLRRYYSRRLPPSMVDDAVQDALIAIHEKRHTYDTTRPFGPWLAAVARYKWIDRLRAMKAAPTEELNDDLSVPDHGEAVSSAHSLERLLGTLKPAQAQVIRLVKLQGYSVEEAAKRTGQSISLVKVNIHRGLGRLAALVSEQSDAQ